MNRTVHAASGHTLFVKSVNKADLPKSISKDADAYTTFYVVKNWDDKGKTFMWLAKGHEQAKNQIVAFYGESGKEFWAGYGLNFADAINGAARDGWMYH